MIIQKGNYMLNFPSDLSSSSISSNSIESKTTQTIEYPINIEEVELACEDLSDYIAYIGGEKYAKTDSEEIERLEKKFSGIDHDAFLDKMMEIFTNLFSNKNRELVETIRERVENSKWVLRNISSYMLCSPEFSNQYKTMSKQEDFKKLASILSFVSQLGSGLLTRSDIFSFMEFIDKKFFIEKYNDIVTELIGVQKTIYEENFGKSVSHSHYAFYHIKFYYYTEKYNELIQECDSFLKVNTKEQSEIPYFSLIECYLWRGIAKRELNQIDRGEEDFNKVIEMCVNQDYSNYLSPEKASAKSMMIKATAYLELGKIDEATTLFKSISKITGSVKDEPEFSYLLARIDFEKNKFFEAYNNILAALTLYPDLQEYLIFKKKIENGYRINLLPKRQNFHLNSSSVVLSPIINVEEMTEIPIKREEVESALVNFCDYILYIKGHRGVSSTTKFACINHDEFLDVLTAILRRVYNDNNREPIDMKFISNRDFQIFFDPLKFTPEFLTAYKVLTRNENFTKLAEVRFLISLIFERKSGLKNDIFDYIKYIEKNQFKYKYYDMLIEVVDDHINNKKEDIVIRLRKILFCSYAEKHQELIKECDSYLIRQSVGNLPKLYCLSERGKAKEKLNMIDVSKDNEDLNEVIKLSCDKNDVNSIIYRVNVYLKLGKIDEAFTACCILQGTVMDVTQQATLSYLLAKIDFAKNQYADAYDKISNALTLNPGLQEYLILKKNIENIFKFNEKFLQKQMLQDTNFFIK